MAPDFEGVLRRAIGLNPDSIGTPAIQAAVRARIQARDAASPEEYWGMLQGSPEELQALIENVVVSETWFFRDGAPFVEFARLAGEAAGLGGMLRILSVPCATGEEPYSLAMALMDHGIAPQRFRVEAIDVSQRVVDHARRAVYGRNSFRGHALGFRDRYFRQVEEGYLLAEIVRERVTFRAGNLLTEDLAAVHGIFDFIFCRNLLIYLDEASRATAVQNLHRALSPHGVLFVGHAEMPVVTPHGFAVAEIPGAFACRKRTAADRPARPADTKRIAAASGRRTSPADVAKARARTMPARSTPAVPLAPAPPVISPKPASAAKGALLEEARRLADQGRLAEAAALCTGELERHGDSAQAHYLLGLTRDAAHDDAAAAAHYRKALYLDPSHYQALLHLGYILEKQGDSRGAQRLHDRASRAQLSTGGKAA